MDEYERLKALAMVLIREAQTRIPGTECTVLLHNGTSPTSLVCVGTTLPNSSLMRGVLAQAVAESVLQDGYKADDVSAVAAHDAAAFRASPDRKRGN